ncbi:hypothetical protein GH714_027949 [Hevea brasiliensis]|uniref:Protein kinase domain-containing protein n=1 Tax=Hevea brasiliensis TaxID=3981 RepID=A0A6A6KRM9_HEVBR|nr:hypothetical protein GH714_027949 [Hevea brasiliensis]
MDLSILLTINITITVLYFVLPPACLAHKLETLDYKFGPFNSSYYTIFAVLTPATISNDALQVTPDSAGNFTLSNRSGRVFFNHTFTLWEELQGGAARVASFNSSFLINVFRVSNTSGPGEGFAFLISPDLSLPLNSEGQYLGLTNSTTDGDSSNGIVAIELDTFKQDFDPDDNHMGLNIHSVRSNKTVSLSNFGIQIAPVGTKVYMIWVHYDGVQKVLQVYMAERAKAKPTTPVLTADLDLKGLVNQNSYFGFAASTGSAIQLNCVLGWNLTVEQLPSSKNGDDDNNKLIKICIGVGVPVFVLLLIGVVGLTYYQMKKRADSDLKLLGALKSLPGTPREFRFGDLKNATNNFDEKNKLGQGGFGVVYKGLLPNEKVPVAVKKFSRDNLKGQDDFLAELTIINRLRHKHLVRLLELEGVPGTMGYIAPECFHTGKATCESDVYGFGAVVLEVVCGQRPWTKIADFQFLVDWVWWLHREGRLLEAVDERLGNDYVVEEAQRLLLLGLACSHPIASERPKTQDIFQMISGSVAVPRVPPFKPAFVWPSATGPDITSNSSRDITANTTP